MPLIPAFNAPEKAPKHEVNAKCWAEMNQHGLTPGVHRVKTEQREEQRDACLRERGTEGTFTSVHQHRQTDMGRYLNNTWKIQYSESIKRKGLADTIACI